MHMNFTREANFNRKVEKETLTICVAKMKKKKVLAAALVEIVCVNMVTKFQPEQTTLSYCSF